MTENALHPGKAGTLADLVAEHAGELTAHCYQCGKCSAGCPLIEEMDIPPSRVLRMIQLRMPQFDDRVLRSLSIWLCLGCETCFVRCPKEVGLPRIMDILRKESLRRHLVHKKAKEILAFHKAFLKSVKHAGRMHEVGLIIDYKLATKHLMQDVVVAPRMMLLGKLGLLTKKIEGASEVERIFDETIDQAGGER
jgi:heterodisulfide reductase subunit C2